MTYREIQTLCNGKSLPIAATNQDGENVIIEQGSERWRYQGESWDRHFYKLITAQRNGWTRINMYFDDGVSDEFYTLS